MKWQCGDEEMKKFQPSTLLPVPTIILNYTMFDSLLQLLLKVCRFGIRKQLYLNQEV